MAVQLDGVKIGTISGGIVNFGGAVFISPISVTKSVSGSGGSNEGAAVITTSGTSLSDQRAISDILNRVRTMLG